jgi:hypothetical protein
MTARFSFPLPHGGREQGEGARKARAFKFVAPMLMRVSPQPRLLHHPLTPALSPGGGEGVDLRLGATHA